MVTHDFAVAARPIGKKNIQRSCLKYLPPPAKTIFDGLFHESQIWLEGIFNERQAMSRTHKQKTPSNINALKGLA